MKSTIDTYQSDQLYIDDSERSSASVTVASGQNLSQYQVVGVVKATGLVVAHNPAAADGSEKAVYIMPYAVDATGGAVACSAYNKGGYNADLLVWHANVNTLEKRQGAFAGTGISVGKLRKS